MKTFIKTAALLLTSATIIFGCGKKPEAGPVTQQTPPPTAKQTPSTLGRQPETKPVEVNAPQPADENKTYYVKRLEQPLSLKEINRRIQREELWPTDTYLEFPENQYVGPAVDGVEKPLSSVKGIATFIKPSSPPWSRNVIHTIGWPKGGRIVWVRVSPAGELFVIVTTPDPQMPSTFIYRIVGIDKKSGDLSGFLICLVILSLRRGDRKCSGVGQGRNWPL